MFFWIFDFFMAVLDPGRLSIGFPDPVGSILAEYEPEPTHLDPIHRIFPKFRVLISSANPLRPNYSLPFSPMVAFLKFLIYSTSCAFKS